MDKKAFSLSDNLGYLMGVILSLVALFFILDIILSLLFYEPTNLEIAEGNIQSIQEFVAYGEDQSYGGVGEAGCFNFFRMHNQGTFQLESNEKKYLFIIEEEEISLASNTYLSRLKDGSDLESVQKQKVKSFAQPVEIRYDETYEGNNFWYGASFGIFGDSSTDINYGSQEVDYVVLHPNYGEDEYHYKAFFFFEGVNEECNDPDTTSRRKEVLDCDQQRYQTKDIRYITHNPVKNMLFFPSNELSTTLARGDLCLREEYNREQLMEFYRKTYLENINSLDNRIEIGLEGEGATESFVWQNGPICRNNSESESCEDFFPAEPQDYGDFVFRILKFANERDYSIAIDSVENLCYESVEKKDMRFSQIFDKGFDASLEDVFDHDGGTQGAGQQFNSVVGEYDMPAEEYRDIAYEFGSHNTEVNGFTGPQTRMLFYQDGRVWFYIPDEESPDEDSLEGDFYSVSEDFLRKREEEGQTTYYFNKEDISLESETGLNSKGSGDDKVVYHGKITVEERTYDVFLSAQQLAAIQSYGRCGGEQDE